MPLEASELVNGIDRLLWPFLRISALLLAAPLFGARTLPVRARVLLAVMLALLVAPLVPPPPAVEPLSAAGLLIAAQEVAIGVAMGFILQMVMSAFSQAGEYIALGMGLGFASINDPQNGLSIPVVSQYYVVVATLVFLSFDGHVIIIDALVRSFQTLPVGVDGPAPDAFRRIALWGSQMYASAVLVALPAVTSLLLVNLGFGVITRSAPQLNIFAVGFPIMILVGLGVMFLTLPALTDQVLHIFDYGFALMGRVLTTP
jgi:flagellar biosynthetic protein FliR